MSKKLRLGGNERSVPAFYEGQNTKGSPNHYESVEEATRLRSAGRARAINRGKAILIRGPRRHRNLTRDSSFSRWKVLGQTPKHKANGPGFPHWGAV